MDRGLYKDFDGKEPNTIFNVTNDTDDGSVELRKMTLKHLIAGDSDSAYFSVPEKIVNHLDKDEDRITEFCDNVAGYVNDKFPSFIEKAFNCPKERNDSMVAEREVVSDKSLFLTKKRYIMHVVNNEGKKVDKMKIMGVEIKKSSTTVMLKRHLMELVNMILDGYSDEEVKHDIRNRMKEEFYDADLMDIAKPTSIKTLAKAEKSYRMTGSYKGIAWQAKAAMMWNDGRDSMDERLVPGMKIGVLAVNHREYNKIGYPIDLTKLPQWFLSHTFDYDTMWNAHYKTINNYLESMEWDGKSMRQKALQRSGWDF